MSFLTTLSFSLAAQTEKGSVLLGTSVNLYSPAGTSVGASSSAGIGFSSSTTTASIAGGSSDEKSKGISYNFSPSCGYFVLNGLALGVSVGVSGNKDTEEVSKDVVKLNTISVSPYARYYFSVGKKVQPYLEVSGGFSKSKIVFTYGADGEKFEVSQKPVFGGGKVGAAIFLGSKTSLDLFVGYSGSSLKDEETIFDIPVETKTKSNSFGLGIGLSFFL